MSSDAGILTNISEWGFRDLKPVNNGIRVCVCVEADYKNCLLLYD